MHTYETILITRPTLTEDDERSLIDTLASIISDGGGNMVHRDRMGKRRLAYPILKEDDGVYTRFLFDSDPDVSAELERRARLQDNVLRFMTIRLEREWARDAKAKAIEDQQAAKEAAAEAERKAAEPDPEPEVEAEAEVASEATESTEAKTEEGAAASEEA